MSIVGWVERSEPITDPDEAMGTLRSTHPEPVAQ